MQLVCFTDLYNHEELFVCLDDLVKLADVLMVEFLHSRNLSTYTWKVLLQQHPHVKQTTSHTLSMRSVYSSAGE